MYSREVGEQVLTFGVSGKLVRNTLVMYDRQTDSLWPQILGEAVDGPLTGESLTFLPAVHTTWAEWRAEHPDTVALVKGYSGNRDSYTSYYRSGQTGVIGETYEDDRLYEKEFVIGVILDDEQVAYPYSILNDQPVVNDTVGSQKVLVVFNPASGAGVVYDREVAGQTLTFRRRDEGLGEGLSLRDQETGSIWNGLSGTAVDGPLAGTQLSPVKSTRSFWFSWKDWYPSSRLYGVE